MAKKKKKQLTQQQEFEVMKMVLDKVLWVGFIIMGWALFRLVTLGTEVIVESILLIVAGAVILALLSWMVVREYEIIK